MTPAELLLSAELKAFEMSWKVIDHLVVSNFNFAHHVWLRFPLVGCDNARVLFPSWPDLELVDDDVPAIDVRDYEWYV